MAGAQGCCEGKIAGLYDLERTLGKGHFAVVKLARHVFTGQRVAVKVIDKSKLAGDAAGQLLQEVRCMKLVQHPNVVRLYEVIDTHAKLYLILELGDGGDMFDHIMRHEGGLAEARAKHYFAQIVHAISYCHKLHVVHRDLKPENVVFFQEQGVVKLTDFGFSNRFQPGKMLTTSCGSLAYSAPEILLGDEYDAPAVGKGWTGPPRVPCAARGEESPPLGARLLSPALAEGSRPCGDRPCARRGPAEPWVVPGEKPKQAASLARRLPEAARGCSCRSGGFFGGGCDAGRKPARDAGVWAEELRKFPLLRPHPANRFLSAAPSALPLLAGVQGARPGVQGAGLGAPREALWGQRGCGREAGPEPAPLEFGAAGFSKTKHKPLKEKRPASARGKAALELQTGMVCGGGRKISWWLCRGKGREKSGADQKFSDAGT